MVPNQYWTPGMFSSMPLMGKYYVYYGADFVPPAELGRKNVHRWVYELFNDNSGICRFHRKWAETIVDEILSSHYQDFNVDYKAHQFKLAKAIFEREQPKAIFWESERVMDLVQTFLENWQLHGLKNPELDAWLVQFRQDKKAAAKAFWSEIQRGTSQAFADGEDAIPDNLSPAQNAARK
jgi:glyceraldehyde-3-phosphate dehydrogenase (ferredoxin)